MRRWAVAPPYRLSSVEAGRSLRYERVKDWWAKDLPVARGLYNFDTIHIDYYRDMSVALEAFKAGQFDFNLEYSAKDWATGYESPALRSGEIIQTAVKNHNPVACRVLLSISASQFFKTVACVKPLLCYLIMNGPTSSCFTALTSALTAFLKTQDWRSWLTQRRRT